MLNRQPFHTVMRGVPVKIKIIDGQYCVMLSPDAYAEVLAEASPEAETGLAYPSVLVVKDPRTRIVAIALGHTSEAHGNPAYQAMLVNPVRRVAE